MSNFFIIFHVNVEIQGNGYELGYEQCGMCVRIEEALVKIHSKLELRHFAVHRDKMKMKDIVSNLQDSNMIGHS